MFLKLLFETRVAHAMPCAIQKIIADISRHIQPRISHICCKITVFAGMFKSPLPHYGHQIWQGGHIQWGAPNDKVTWPFDHVVLWDHVTNQKHFSTTTVPKATKLGKMINYLDGLLHIKSDDPLIAWSFKIMWQIETTLATKLGRMMTRLGGLLTIKS